MVLSADGVPFAHMSVSVQRGCAEAGSAINSARPKDNENDIKQRRSKGIGGQHGKNEARMQNQEDQTEVEDAGHGRCARQDSEAHNAGRPSLDAISGSTERG